MASVPHIYLDQSIISIIENNNIKFKSNPGFSLVYSDCHFYEIQRSESPEKYLSALKRIEAKYLVPQNAENGNFTDFAKIFEDSCPTENYRKFSESNYKQDPIAEFIDPIIAWINGGGDAVALTNIAPALSEYLSSFQGDFSAISVNSTLIKNLIGDLAQATDFFITQGNEIQKLRTALGEQKGNIGSLQGKDVIKRIWEIAKPNVPGVSCDQFFGFDPHDKSGYESGYPIYPGIITCCAVLDLLGYQAEAKCRKIEKIPNIRSDATHIANSVFCDMLLSADKRMVNRANAIYDYKKLHKTAALLKID